MREPLFVQESFSGAAPRYRYQPRPMDADREEREPAEETPLEWREMLVSALVTLAVALAFYGAVTLMRDLARLIGGVDAS